MLSVEPMLERCSFDNKNHFLEPAPDPSINSQKVGFFDFGMDFGFWHGFWILHGFWLIFGLFSSGAAGKTLMWFTHDVDSGTNGSKVFL